MNVRPLEDEDIEKLRYMLRGGGWNEVVKPALQARRAVLVAMLIDPAKRSGETMTDDEMRGRIRESEWVLTRFEQAVEEYDHSKRLDERDAEAAAASP